MKLAPLLQFTKMLDVSEEVAMKRTDFVMGGAATLGGQTGEVQPEGGGKVI